MTANRDFKRLVRGRMRKTGESYTAARAHLLRNAPTPEPAVADPSPRKAPADYARIAGIADEAVKAKTGCTWERWVWALDRVEAHTWPHREIARYVKEKYHIPSWWTQMVTVGYERIKGLREKGQRRSGTFEVGKSKVVGVPVRRLYRAFSDSRTRRRWLPDVALKIRTAVPNKSLRISWPDGTRVEVYFTARGTARSSVQVQHTGLPDRAAAAKTRELWTAHLSSLAGILAKKSAAA